MLDPGNIYGERGSALDQLSVVISEQRDLEATRRRLIRQALHDDGCSIPEIAEVAGLTPSGVRYLLDADPLYRPVRVRRG